MSNCYTHASFIIPLTSEQKDFAVRVIECFEDDAIDLRKNHKTKEAKAYDNDVYRMAKKLAKNIDDYEPDWALKGFDYDTDESEGLKISHDEHINTDNAAYFAHLILKHFNSDKYVCIDAAHICDKAIVDHFGGTALFVTKKGVNWMSTSNWLERQVQLFDKKQAK